MKGRFTIKTRRLIILGVIFLACLGALIGVKETVILAIGGLLTLLKGDDDN